VRRRRLVGGAVLAGAAALVAILVLVLGDGGEEGPRPPHTRPGTPPPATTPPAAPAAPAPPLPAPQGTELGMNVNRLFNDRAYSPDRVDEQLAALRATGVTLARSDVLWEVAEPRPPDADGTHHYDWGFADGVAGALARRGIRWLALVDYAATWSASVAGNTHSAPSDPAQFAAFAAAFARRYGRDGAFWGEHPALPALPVTTYEIWNEPDLSIFWAPAPDAARYADLFVRARAAVKAVDPRARVIVGGLSNAPGWIPQLFGARPDLADQTDGVGIHPYARTPLGVLAVVQRSRRALAAAGAPDAPLYVTEFGWVGHPASSPKYAPAALRPDYVARTTEALGRLDCGVAAVVPYTWVTPEQDPADEEDWFGLRHPDDRASAASDAFAAAAQRLERGDAPPVRLCGAGGG
jgi:hypothetical protein